MNNVFRGVVCDPGLPGHEPPAGLLISSVKNMHAKLNSGKELESDNGAGCLSE